MTLRDRHGNIGALSTSFYYSELIRLSYMLQQVIQCDLVIEFSSYHRGNRSFKFAEHVPFWLYRRLFDLGYCDESSLGLSFIYHRFPFKRKIDDNEQNNLHSCIGFAEAANEFPFLPVSRTLVVFSSSNYSFSCTLNRIGHRFKNFLRDLQFCGAEYFARRPPRPPRFFPLWYNSSLRRANRCAGKKYPRSLLRPLPVRYLAKIRPRLFYVCRWRKTFFKV